MSWLTGWGFRKDHFINPASGADQNYQKRIVVHFGFGSDDDENVYLNGNCQADFGDVRFTSNTGVALLDYWIDKKVDSSYAICWVEIAEDLSVYDKKIQVYYGKPGSTSIANGGNTFIFFDDFEIDLSNWVVNPALSAVLSTDFVYSGTKSVKLPLTSPTGITLGHWQSPNGNIAVHIHFYDEMLPLRESTMCSIDAGESEQSWIGIKNDIGQYEYQLQGTTYNSGVDRVIGWHEFITRCTNNLKQFIIDGNIMPVTGTGNWCPRTWIINSSPTFSDSPSYWDTVFVRKFVNPEPAHGVWGNEENEAGYLPTTFVAEDVENSISGTPLILEDMIYPLDQKPLDTEEDLLSLLGSPHILTSSEDLLVALIGAPHIPTLSEDLLVVLTKLKFLSVEDSVFTLFGSLHVPISSEDLLVALARELRSVEDLIPDLSGSFHVPTSSDEVTMSLLAKRLRRVLMDLSMIGAFPIIGGSHVIQSES